MTGRARRLAALLLTGAALLLTSCDDGGGASCAGQDCSGHGLCVETSVGPRCVCDNDYVESGLSCIPGSADGDGDGDVDVCTTAAECRDELYCNGEERCDPDHDEADELGCVAGEPVDCDDGNPSTTDTCSERVGRCLNSCPDRDGDGHGAATCVDSQGDPLGDDCDDHDAERFPGNPEVCDEAGHDEDCDLTTVGERDEDLDGSVAASCCNMSTSGAPICGPDCDDSDPTIHPGAQELCDAEGVDENCDGRVNEFLTVFCYPDWDDDGYAAAGAMPREHCPVEGRAMVDGCPPLTTNLDPVGEGEVTADCDDTDDEVHPFAPENCDGIDNDCDGALAGDPTELDVDFDETDRDGDGFLECARGFLTRDCADDDPRAHPGQESFFTTPVEVRGGFDFNCDGLDQIEDPTMGGCFPAVDDLGHIYCIFVEGWFTPRVMECGVAAPKVTGCVGAIPSTTERCFNVSTGWQLVLDTPACR